MAQVPGQVLSWLYGVLHEYQDPQHTYSDVARCLSIFPSLVPRTEVYTYENGSSALLLTISGTLPVDFRGTTYRFPVKLWIPQAFAQECPIAYVIAGKAMLVRPGQHVGVDGRVYHPYLRDWRSMSDRASIADFLGFLQQAFAREPPVVSRAQQQQLQRPLGNGHQQMPRSSPGAPTLPPKQRPGSNVPQEISSQSMPPPRPPKPGEDSGSSAASRDLTRNGPPLPPLPGQSSRNATPPQHYQNGYGQSGSQQSRYADYRDSRSDGRPPIPAVPQYVQQQHRSDSMPSRVSPTSPSNGFTPIQSQGIMQPPFQRQHLPYQQTQLEPAYQQTGQTRFEQQIPPQTYRMQPMQYQQQYQQAPQKSQPPPDLLSDPFEVAISGPAASSALEAPPIPLNPEKEYLLHALSQTLVQQAQQKISQNLSAIPALQAQHAALLASHNQLESELSQLALLSQSLASNESILRHNIAECDARIAAAKSKPPPAVDEVLVATSLVAQQLWQLCAEEAAIREAMYVLQKAVDRGRIGGEAFVKQMRGLGREVFLKMVLIKKCGRGLGLEV